ncbi:[FeFe] hydrogenase H-cluster radical SAM maturase HydG [Desulfovibrio aminophilus]|uniref:[FeFe] hydrogenase H-cluster radical SAM maturase HydG n=1 Tax=Desulfovibrio aminophilus TaxID=81425 RepID=UPI003391375C
MSEATRADWVDEDRIAKAMRAGDEAPRGKVREILLKALDMQGLDLGDVAVLSAIRDETLLRELFHTARKVKEEIYGRRLVLFAPLYISNLCKNECLYCAFRASNKELKRRALSQEEIAEETRIIIRQGHKRILLVAGESYPEKKGFDYVLESIATCYATKEGPGEIRRMNVNVAPLAEAQFRDLKATGIGTYQLFQETYHRDTYARVHQAGPKSDFDWRATAMDRAMRAGIDDVGVGVLFGLYDWRYEVMALMLHIAHLEKEFGVGCHTISVPRIEPASGSDMASAPPHEVSDEDFRKIVAILRLAVPYTGMIMSTRENAEMRRETLELGVSQISAGSRTNPGGYADDERFDASQFQLGDHRSLSEVITDVSELGYIPSFCTGCYRLGRTGQDFMDMAKPGLIKEKCGPNALSTFLEYLRDFAPADLGRIGERAIGRELEDMAPKTRRVAERMLEKVREGRSDVFC